MYFKQNIKLNEEKRETFRANYSAVLLFFLNLKLPTLISVIPRSLLKKFRWCLKELPG